MMGRNEGRYRFAARSKLQSCSTQTRQPPSIGVGRRFLVSRYQTAPGYVVPADLRLTAAGEVVVTRKLLYDV